MQSSKIPKAPFGFTFIFLKMALFYPCFMKSAMTLFDVVSVLLLDSNAARRICISHVLLLRVCSYGTEFNSKVNV